MATDWNLIRKLMNAAIDSCERVERLDISSQEQGATTEFNGCGTVSIWDFLQSSWTYPENMRDVVVRARHQLKVDKQCTNELARALVQSSQVCAELIGMDQVDATVNGVDPHSKKTTTTVKSIIDNLADWYTGHFAPGVEKAIKEVRN